MSQQDSVIPRQESLAVLVTKVFALLLWCCLTALMLFFSIASGEPSSLALLGVIMLVATIGGIVDIIDSIKRYTGRQRVSGA